MENNAHTANNRRTASQEEIQNHTILLTPDGTRTSITIERSLDSTTNTAAACPTEARTVGMCPSSMPSMAPSITAGSLDLDDSLDGPVGYNCQKW
eukprot:scaffold33426_cov46-Attheya_sp.AAC.3